MFAAYLVIWAIAFVFVFGMWSQSRKLARQLEEMRQLVAEAAAGRDDPS
jgi:uncharacterized membrane protein